MEKTVLAAAGYDTKKYYLAEEFENLPDNIKSEIRTICAVLADKLMCTFIMGFYEDGEIYFETVKSEDAIDFDDIGAALEIKEIERNQKELLKSLKLWYIMFKTPEGEQLRQEFLKNQKNS